MDFSSSACDGEVFTDLDLRGGTLEDAAFYDCRFEGCGFNEASLKRSRFVDCLFSHCDLSMADLTDTELSDVKFEHTALVAINWSLLARTSLLPLELRFERCTLNYATFRDLDLSGSTFEDCLAHEAMFSGVKLLKATLRGTDFDRATFYDCDLSGADLQGAQNYQISVRQNRVKGLKVSFPEALGLLAGLEVTLT